MSSIGPVERMTARSKTFSSSRMLPGQGYSCSCCIVCLLVPSKCLPMRGPNLFIRKCTSSGMSSLRSRSGGRRTGNTLRR